MKVLHQLVVGLMAFALYACSADHKLPASDPSELTAENVENLIFFPGQANLYLDEETALMLESLPVESRTATPSSTMNNVLADIGATSLERLFPYAGEFEARTREMGLHRWYKVQFDPNVSLDQASALFAKVDGVLTFERNLKATACSLDHPFNDPQLPNQWQYYNPGARSDWTPGADMDVYAVWKYFTTGNPGVKVAIIDSGVQLDHEDLAANADAADSFNFITQTSVIQPENHGTHVAGTIAAVNNNGIGVSGLAGGDAAANKPGVKLMSLQIMGSSGSGSGSGEQAIKWAADHGAVLCNNSWGFSFEDEKGNYLTDEARRTHEFYLQPNEGDYRSSLKSAIDYFNAYAGLDASGNQVGPMAGGLVVFAAGNDDKPWGAPAGYPGVVAVGSIGPHGYRTYYSNYGDWVDISATGGDANYGTILSTFINNGYGSYQGTSMACPHITGVAALLVSYFGGQGFTRDNLLERLLGGTSPLVSLSGQPIGRLSDAYAAFTLGEDMTPAGANDIEGKSDSNSITVSWSVTGSSDGVPAAGYYLFYGTSEEAVAASTPQKRVSGVTRNVIITTTNTVGEKLSQVFPALKFETSYYFKLVGYDAQGNYGPSSPILTVLTPANQPPVITVAESVNNLSLKNFEKKELHISVSDPDGHATSVEHLPGSSSEKWAAATSGYLLFLSGSGLAPGEYASVIRAKDTYGATSELQIVYRILPNQPPVVVKEIPNQIIEGSSKSISFELGPYFNDPDEEPLVYKVNNPAQAVIHTNVNEGVLYITSLGYGLVPLTVTALDARGDSAEIQFQVLVRENGVEYQLYPNPVVNDLYVATGTELEQTQVTIASSTGNIVYDETISASAFVPGVVSMQKFAPGKYVVTVRFAGKEYQQTVIKK